MRESAVEAKCRKYAIQHGWIVYKLDPTGNRGAFDRVYVGPFGVVLFIEHKQRTGAKRDHQIAEQARLRKRGHVAEFVFTFEAFVKLLDKWDLGPVGELE